MIQIIGYLFAIVIGVSLGLIGGGGSILAVPILKYLIGVPVKEAVAMSLLIVGVVSVVGAIPHWRQGNVNFRTAAVFAPTAMAGAYLGAKLAALPFITDTIQLVCFGLVMVVASVLMIRKGSEKLTVQAIAAAPNGPQPEQFAHNIPNASHLETGQAWTKSQPNVHRMMPGWLAFCLEGLEGLGVGILTGFVGVGGGFAIIPALVLLGGIPMKEAVGTSLVIIAFKSATGFMGYVNQVNLDREFWQIVIFFTAAATIGIIAGAHLSKKIDSNQLQKGFGYFVLAVAAFVLIQR